MTLPGETIAIDDAGINAVSCAGNWPPSGLRDHHVEFDLAVVLPASHRWSRIAVTTPRDLVPCRIRSS